MSNVCDADAGKRGNRRGGGKRSNCRDIHLQRVDFLLEAAKHMASVCPNVSRGYLRELKEISEKHVIRLDSAIKRAFCKGCNTLLVPGKTAVVTAEYHGPECRQAPGTEIEHNCAPEAAKAHQAHEEITSLHTLDDDSVRWLIITCSICTRTRRRKLQNQGKMHSESSPPVDIQ